ncbi:MAG: hypothetical protein WB608_16235 [Terracidiphilus sp.]
MAVPQMANPNSIPLGGMQAAQAQDTGLVSAATELIEAVQDNAASARALEEALGISSPEKEAGGPAPSPSSLLQVLRAAISRVRNTNEHLYQVIRHINS